MLMQFDNLQCHYYTKKGIRSQWASSKTQQKLNHGKKLVPNTDRYQCDFYCRFFGPCRLSFCLHYHRNFSTVIRVAERIVFEATNQHCLEEIGMNEVKKDLMKTICGIKKKHDLVQMSINLTIRHPYKYLREVERTRHYWE